MTRPRRGAEAFPANRLAALCVAAVALAGFAATYGFDPVPPGLPGLGAVEFPRLICALLLAMAALLALQESPPPDPEIAPPITRDALAIFAACLAFVPVMAGLGMLGAIAVFLVVAGRLWGETRWALLVAVSAGFTLCLWLVFVKVFRLTLPGGWLLGG